MKIANNLTVELKKIHLFKGHDGYGLSAEIWINGINCMAVFDDARGGQFEYHPYTINTPNAAQIKANIKLLEKHIKSLPKVKSTIDDFLFNMDMDMFINQLLEKQEKEKAIKNTKRK